FIAFRLLAGPLLAAALLAPTLLLIAADVQIAVLIVHLRPPRPNVCNRCACCPIGSAPECTRMRPSRSKEPLLLCCACVRTSRESGATLSPAPQGSSRARRRI